MTGQAIQARKGDPIHKTVELRDFQGRSLIDVFDGTETLTVRLWAGDDRVAIVPAPVATWDDAEAGLVHLDAPGTDTLTLDRGTYKLEVLIDDEPVWSGGMEILAAPGDALALPSYGTYDGMIRRAGQWITRLKDEATQAAFVEERHEALIWTHRQVMARARSMLLARSRGYLGDYDTGVFVSTTSGLSDTTLDGRIGWLQARLDDVGVIVTPSLVDANEHYACAMVLGRTMTAKDEGDGYQARASYHESRANRLLSSVTFRIDSGDDEINPTFLSLGPV